MAKLRQAAMEQGLEVPEDRPAWEPRPLRAPRTFSRELAMAE